MCCHNVSGWSRALARLDNVAGEQGGLTAPRFIRADIRHQFQ